MGCLKTGRPLSFKETSKRNERIRLLGTLEFLKGYLHNARRRDEVRQFGHECEYLLLHLDGEKREAKLSPCAPRLIESIKDVSDADKYIFMPEFASYMIEVTPHRPWELDGDYAPKIAAWFNEAPRVIRRGLEEIGVQNVYPFTLTSYPLLGVPNSVCQSPRYLPESMVVMNSDFCDDILVNPHPRFVTLARNILERRGKKISINTPSFIKNSHVTTDGLPEANVSPVTSNGTSEPTLEADTIPEPKRMKKEKLDYIGEADKHLSEFFISPDNETMNPELASLIDNAVAFNHKAKASPVSSPPANDENSIYMDAMVFGMGMGCLQVTLSCVDEAEARYLYDQLAVLAPLLLTMTAATAAFRGIVSEFTTRWSVLSQSVDDRCDEEHSQIPLSRFSTVTLFISKEPYLVQNYAKLNDVKVPSHKEVYDVCLHAGLDRIISRHFAAIFARDALLAFEEDLDEVDIHTTDAHFESFQSINWNTVRFKPPPCKDGSYQIPWRVELRCCESQLREEDCVSTVTLIVTLMRVLIKEHWNLYMPMSQVHENMVASETQDAITKHKFHFVKDLEGKEQETGLFTLYEIFFGNEKLGLFRRCAEQHKRDLESGAITKDSYNLYMKSLKIFEDRMRGRLRTSSQEMRDFFLNHHDFKGDGRVTHSIVYDLFEPLTRRFT